MVRLRAVIAVWAAWALSGMANAQVEIARQWRVEGRIEQTDTLAGEYRVDEYRLRLEGGRPYRFAATSSDFDTFLSLARDGETATVIENDDFGDGVNSFFYYRPAESGTFVLRIRSFGSSDGGAYSLRVEARPVAPPPLRSGPASRVRLEWGIWGGTLEPSDADQDGRYYEDHALTMRAGETRLIAVESAEFDPVVWILRAGQREDADPIDMDDDAGPGFNALLGFHAEEAGEYLIRVMAFRLGSTGRYRLRVSNPMAPPVAAGDSPVSGD